MKSPLVSIIIPVYNVAPYLQKCLDSCIGQTYKNIEIISVNDGSTDNSLEILRQYEQNYGNIQVISQKNAGNSVARNRGMERSSGKYLYFLDADDYLLPETMENLVLAMEQNNLDLVRFAAEPFFDGIEPEKFNQNVYDQSKFFKPGIIYGKNEFLRACIKGFSSSPCLYMIKREVVVNQHLRFKPGMRHEDELFSCELYLNTNRAMYDARAYYKRRYRQGSIMTSQNDKYTNLQSFDAYFRIIDEVNQLLEQYTSPMERKFLKSRIRSLYIGMVTKEIDPQYKKKKIAQLPGVSGLEKKCYLVWHWWKENIKRVILR